MKKKYSMKLYLSISLSSLRGTFFDKKFLQSAAAGGGGGSFFFLFVNFLREMMVEGGSKLCCYKQPPDHYKTKSLNLRFHTSVISRRGSVHEGCLDRINGVSESL